MVTYGGNDMCWGVQLRLDEGRDSYFKFTTEDGKCAAPSDDALPATLNAGPKFPARD
jgi:hypothetical protein